MLWPKNEQLEKRFLDDAGELRRIYWWIRYSRFHKDLRRHYRRAEKEKARLAGLGYDQDRFAAQRSRVKRPAAASARQVAQPLTARTN